MTASLEVEKKPERFGRRVTARTLAWAVPSGSVLGAAYGALLNLPSLASSVSGGLLAAFTVAGAFFGCIYGVALGFVAALAIVSVPIPRDHEPTQLSKYLHSVRRAAGISTLVAGCLPMVLFLSSNVVAAVVFAVPPAVIAASAAYALAPRAVRWYLNPLRDAGARG